ncbi:hypothetical protein [Nocardioides sp. B-3]|uniref:hypothetical protein n=1 Tax=Nocardioides sp. B-3 TaxID=2895565 RepID=UPI0021533CFF|nr:hypothetical protein [Nocardioides sp. B-3]UUZ59117.1 hypothetical protein LP418_24775 [Nocardioides sp. B-3]
MYLCGRGFVPTHNTGRSPGEAFEAKALFQMKFYALVIWRTRGVVPAMLQLVYLGNGELLRYEPDEADLLATERKIEAIWRAIKECEETRGLAPEQVGALLVVLLQAPLPRVRRHTAARARTHAHARSGRRPRHRRGHRRRTLIARWPYAAPRECHEVLHHEPLAHPGVRPSPRATTRVSVRSAPTTRSSRGGASCA